ncbi:4-coumarate--CoA ligase 1-like [Anoplophora glabripennis]|uniref:4-coumarate--CoA ligase 1-like n=1 Tax=Anoplophora glabripennis TaxID=217634 RepID=UPI000874A606|nr:4-coumarate--CoA ligase 1-like [Anoplophora glabripennis]
MLRILKPFSICKRASSTFKNIVKSPGPDIDIPKNVLLSEYLLENINKWTDKVAVECIETKKRYTFLEIRKKSLTLAHFLRNSLKLEEKSCVGILLPNLPEFPIVVLASIQAGLQITPINPNYTPDEIKKQLVLSKAKALFGVAERETELRSVCDNLKIPIIAVKVHQNTSLSTGTINFFDYVTAKQQNFDEIYTKSVTPDDVVLLPFSSGTTGLPKGVQLTHFNLVSNLMQTAVDEFDFYKKGGDEVSLAFLPFFHIYGFMLILIHGLCDGLKLITFPKFTSQLFLTGLREYRPTFIPAVPPIVHMVNTSTHINHSEDLVSVRSMLCGAAPLGKTDIVHFRDLTNGKIDIIQGHGMTETSPLNMVQTRAFEGGLKIGGCGFLVPNTQAKFVSIENSEDQNGLGMKQNGELCIKGPQVMKGYLDNPTATKEMFMEDGWVRTGDIGYYDEDGHIFITDRLKELIKVQGFPVAPAELESLIRKHPSVEDVAVIGVKHEKLGEAPKAFVVLKKSVKLQPKDIEDFVAPKVIKYKHLAGGVTFLEHIPKTPAGKILRRDLKKLI